MAGPLLRRPAPLPLPSWIGALLLALFSLFLALGLRLNDLALLVWATGFGVILAYLLLGGALLRELWRGLLLGHPERVRVALPASGCSPGEAVTVQAWVDVPALGIWGLTPCLRITLESRQAGGARSVTLELDIPRSREAVRATTPALSRGRYHLTRCLLCARDALHAFVCALEIPHEDTLTVYPELPDPAVSVSPAAGDRARRMKGRRRRSEEMLEVRRYVWGDDIRRINWKLYAHLGELYVRLGEDVPPGDSRLFFLLDPGLPRSCRGAPALAWLDRAAGALAAAALAVLDAGLEVTVAVRGRAGHLVCGPGQGSRLLALLASAGERQEHGERAASALPRAGRYRAAVFALPGSPWLESVLRTLLQRGWPTRLVLQRPPADMDLRRGLGPLARPGLPLAARRWLLLPERLERFEQRRVRLWFRLRRRSLERRLDAAMQRFAGAEWGLEDVRVV